MARATQERFARWAPHIGRGISSPTIEEVRETSAKPCPMCRRLFGEHSQTELDACVTKGAEAQPAKAEPFHLMDDRKIFATLCGKRPTQLPDGACIHPSRVTPGMDLCSACVAKSKHDAEPCVSCGMPLGAHSRREIHDCAMARG